jgi:EAL domain-containing protein (putative c-di-GMP-specific phosphodiesterase class I)/CheY-like chemotaxis protein
MSTDVVSTERWNVLLVDDEPEVHQVSRLILADLQFDGRGIELFSAESGAQARELLARENDLALVLLDVVMESDDAGLALVRHIREHRRDHLVQIVLRTGQPGVAPEREVVQHHEINGYWLKTDLTAQRLRTVVVSALRSYRLAQAGRAPATSETVPPDARTRSLAAELAVLRGDAVLWQAQPEVALSSNLVTGVELVPMWRTSTGLLPASRVFEVLTGAAARREHALNVLEHACAWARSWHDGGAALTVSIPAVAECLDDDETLAHAELITRRAALPRGALQLLVSDAHLLRGTSRAQSGWARLRAVGAGLTLFDVGASTLPLQPLAHAAPDRLKIHRTYVRNVASEPERVALARSVIALAHTLHMIAIADGIANDADAQFFRWEGCQLGQGDALAPACAPGDVLALLAAGLH